MSSLASFFKNHPFNIKHQVDVYLDAAKWQQQAMREVVNMLKCEPNGNKVIAGAQKSLNKHNVIPRYERCLAEKPVSYWKHVDKRRVHLKKKIRELANNNALEAGDGSAVVTYCTNYAACIPEVIRGIGQLCMDIENMNPEQDKSQYFEQYSDQQHAALRRFIMLNTLCLSKSERSIYMDVAMQELAFLLAEIEDEWNLWQERVYKEYRVQELLHEHESCPWPSDNFMAEGAVEKLPEGSCGFQLCKPEAIRVYLDMPEAGRQRLSRIEKEALIQIQRHGGQVALATVPANYLTVLSDFRARFPNMAELAELIEGTLNLSTLGGVEVPLQLASGPIILAGPPGTGKTMGLRYLSEQFGIAFTMIGCAELTNGFDISGSSRGWGTGKPGLIARMLLREKSANGIIVLDELDKCHDSTSNFPPTQALFTLLERESAAHFKDEYFDFEMDASRINWMATANDYERIPEPLRDRATKICIGAPTAVQRVSIAGYLYQDLRQRNHEAWGRYFAPELDPSVAWMIASLEGISIRGMKQKLMACLTAVAGGNSGALEEGDLYVSESDAVNVLNLRSGGPGQADSNGLIH